MKRNLVVFLFGLAMVVLALGCEVADKTAIGVKPFKVETQITDEQGKVIFGENTSDQITLYSVDEGGVPLANLKVTLFADGVRIGSSLIAVADPQGIYIPYLFSPQEDEGVVRNNQGEAIGKRVLRREMIASDGLQVSLNPIYEEKATNLYKYLFEPVYGAFKVECACELFDLDFWLKNIWITRGLAELASYADKGSLADISFHNRAGKVNFNIFQLSQVKQMKSYISEGYKPSQLFEIYYPDPAFEDQLPFIIVKPKDDPTNSSPIVSIKADKYQGEVPLRVQFQAEVSDDGKVVSYMWDYGDGDIGTVQNPVHTFNSTGSYEVTCTIEDEYGAKGEDSLTIKVGNRANREPSVEIAAFPQSGVSPLDVQFAAWGFDEDGGIKSYFWDFGDGETISGQYPLHTYMQEGVYTAVCVVTDDRGATGRNVIDISVSEPPSTTLQISATPTQGSAPLTVSFTAVVSGEVTSYLWDFGDGGTSTDQNPTHTYVNAGVFTASCTVTQPSGGTQSDTVTITVTDDSETEDSGTYMVYKASQPITSGTIEFDVTGLSSAGSSKDVMFVLSKGMTKEDYETYRFDIRKYEGGLHLMKSVFVNRANGNFAVEKYWMNRELIYWEPTHTYHFTITWGNYSVSASRRDLTTGEVKSVSLDYQGAGEFGPTYIMIGWNPKYGIPPGGYYSNVKLPTGVSYELVKYKP